MKDVRNIVVATDFSDLANHALDEAIDLAEKLGSKITLVHSYEIPVYGFPDGILVASANVTSEIQTGSQRQLDKAIEAHKGRKVSMTGVLRMGAPWDEINSVASETGASLIVVGTHGRRGLSRALLGSTAERLIRTASLPVLVVHRLAEEAK
jgi:nucleotide-binding universal stress UspA family protein